MSSSFYGKAQEGQPATLRLWREQVVGVEVMGGTQWFLPESGETLGYWLYLAFFGLGVLLWGVLFGWWDGFFLLAFRTFAWMFMGVVPVILTTDALAYGLDTGVGLVVEIVVGVFFIGIAGECSSARSTTAGERRDRPVHYAETVPPPAEPSVETGAMTAVHLGASASCISRAAVSLASVMTVGRAVVVELEGLAAIAGLSASPAAYLP